MHVIRFTDHTGRIRHGCQHAGGPTTAVAGDLQRGFRDTGEPVEVCRLLAPVAPADILCIGLNYLEHVAEGGARPVPERPVLFMKSTGAVQHPGGPILLPRALRSDRVDFEGELAVVIGRDCKNARRDEALSHVAGYTCGNDVSARDWQKQLGGGQWCRGKTFDTFAPLGPCLVTADEIDDPQRLAIRTRLNGELMQDGNTAEMIFDVATLIEFLSGSTTLRAGTVILTGTPHGVGFARNPPRFLRPGDEVEVEIEGIGTLRNPVAEEVVE